MKKHYSIAFPVDGRLPILMVDYTVGVMGKSQRITLQQAKDAVFKAVLQEHMVTLESDLRSDVIADVITIVDKDEYDRCFKDWKAVKPDGTVVDNPVQVE